MYQITKILKYACYLPLANLSTNSKFSFYNIVKKLTVLSVSQLHTFMCQINILQTQDINKYSSQSSPLIIGEQTKLKELLELSEALKKVQRIIFQLNNLQQKSAAEILQCKKETQNNEQLVKRLIKEKELLQNQYENEINQIRIQGEGKEKELIEKIKYIDEEKQSYLNELKKEKEESKKLNTELNDQINELKKADKIKIEQFQLSLKKIERENQSFNAQSNNQTEQIQELKAEGRSKKLRIQVSTNHTVIK